MLSYRVRDIEVSPGLALAPMEGVTDVTFRRLVRTIGGCGLTVTEFIPARSLNVKGVEALNIVQFDPDEHPIAIQIYGNQPDVMADAAKVVEQLGADILDLNMGCPSKSVTARSGGSALMKDPALSREIVASMRAATTLPFTVKMRAGWDADSRNAVEIAKICEGEGAEGLAVHWRTRTDRYGGVRDLSIVAAVKDAVSVPVLANGDVVDVGSALQTLEGTGCDGLMIGRGAIRDPWVFRKIEAALAGRPAPHVDIQERKRVLLEYLDAIRPYFRNDHAVLGRFKSIAKHFIQGVPGGTDLRTKVLRSQTIEAAVGEVESFFATAS